MCIKCNKINYYETSKRDKSSLYKTVNGKKYPLLYCEKCLIDLCPAYLTKNPSRVFNSLNSIY